MIARQLEAGDSIYLNAGPEKNGREMFIRVPLFRPYRGSCACLILPGVRCASPLAIYLLPLRGNDALVILASLPGQRRICALAGPGSPELSFFQPSRSDGHVDVDGCLNSSTSR